MIRFCTTCGARMGCWKKVVGFVAETGHPIRQMTFRCPNNRWWRMGHASDTLYHNTDGALSDQERRNLEGSGE